MSYQLKVIKDSPIGFWPLDEYSGATAFDISGCGNNGTYTGTPETNMLPLIAGGVSGTKITNTAYASLPILNNYYGATTTAGMATKYSSDNDFTLEVWFSPTIATSAETPIFADTTNNIGIYWESGDIIFKASSSVQTRHRVAYSKKAFHVVAIYSVNSLSLYVDGSLVSNTQVSNGFKFTNTSISFQVGPTTNAANSFIVDAPAVYRYSLSPISILRHYSDGNYYVPAIQIVYPDKGTLFTGTDAKIRASFEYTYPASKSWNDFLDNYTYFDESTQSVNFYPTSTVVSRTFVMNDSFKIPTEIGLVSSKIEWRNDLGITVESSIDGTTYVACVNGQPLPQYSKSAFASSGMVYIRVTMTSSNLSKFLPRLSFLAMSFYSNKDLYADNYGDKITSSSEYYLSSLSYPPLSRTYSNGIRAKSGSGFNLNTLSSIKSVEMLFTPSTLAANTLFYAAASSPYAEGKYAWNGSGTVSKTNISKAYINGVDITNQTNITNYLQINEPCHIVIVFTNPVSNVLQFNYLSSGGPDNLYKNIAIYESALTQQTVTDHFNLYTGRAAVAVYEPSISVTEQDFQYYNNDWIVLQSQ